ncbi:hypothetical protein EGR_00393 [Echinococcus granulosus]|uniref:Uncharacterized protein n=1 Tax=Echinococcus granulosus TaxID=6210 RepID=W6VE66_ECHGR|nr:hypothetical protein EGR_00393 [Echinococcus granulosus]EUB65124.1 hypothetical protein EGR_00393 [Echinococcus granulosus]
MFLKNVIQPNDIRNINDSRASLLVEILGEHKKLVAFFFLLQNVGTGDKLSKGLKIIEVDEFLKTRSLLFNSTKEGFNQLTQNEPTGQLIDHHLFNARKLRRFLTSHPDIVNSLLPGRLFENGEKSYETNDLEKQQWPCLPHELDILALLDHLHISNSNELHYSIKGLKSIGKIIKERQLICQELRSNIELLNGGYETIRQQIKSKAKALDSQIRVLQGDFPNIYLFSNSPKKLDQKVNFKMLILHKMTYLRLCSYTNDFKRNDLLALHGGKLTSALFCRKHPKRHEF